MAALVNDRDVLIMSGTRTQPITLPSDITVSGNVTGTVNGVAASTLTAQAAAGYNIQQKLEVSGSAVLKGVLVPTDSGAVKTGSITWNTSTGALTGGTGIAITEWGIIGAAAGVATFTLEAATGAATFKGNITGGSNINITGIGQFGGSQTLNSYNAAIHANPSGAALYGLYCRDGGAAGAALVASGITSGADGVIAQAVGSSGRAIHALGVSGGTGVSAESSGGTALQVIGPMTITSTTRVNNLNTELWNEFRISTPANGSVTSTFNGNTRPSGTAGASNFWLRFTHTNGTVYHIPAWT